MENGQSVFFLSLVSLARVRLLRHTLPISLLILRKKTGLFCSLEHCKLSGRVRLTVVMTQHRTQWW